MSPILIWLFVLTQMVAWAWCQFRAGQLRDRQYLVFCGMMMLGQFGASFECLQNHTWATLVVQIYFFFFTGLGAWQRLRQMRRKGRMV